MQFLRYSTSCRFTYIVKRSRNHKIFAELIGIVPTNEHQALHLGKQSRQIIEAV